MKTGEIIYVAINLDDTNSETIYTKGTYLKISEGGYVKWIDENGRKRWVNQKYCFTKVV